MLAEEERKKEGERCGRFLSFGRPHGRVGDEVLLVASHSSLGA